MRLQGNRAQTACKRFTINVHLPSSCLRQLGEITKLGEPTLPDIEKIAKRKRSRSTRFDMDDPITGMGMQPVNTGLVWGNSNCCRQGSRFPIDIEGKMRMNMKIAM